MAITFPGEIKAPYRPRDLEQDPINVANVGGVEKYGALNASTISVTNLSADSITAGSIDASSITITNINASNISTGTLDAARLNASYIVVDGAASDVNNASTEIAPGKISISGSTQLADWRHSSDNTTIDGGDIYANSVTANQIAANTITASEIAATTITASQIASNTITGSQLSTSRIDTSTQYISDGLKVGGSGQTVTGIVVDGKIDASGELRSGARSTVDKSGSPGDTVSLEVSNNNGDGGVLADFYNEYSEATEIERVAPQWRMSGPTLKAKVLEQILKRAEYKKVAHYNNPDTKMSLGEHEKELDRVLNKKDWSNSVNTDVRGERISTLDYGTLLAFSANGAIPTTSRGQTNIMGVVASFPSRISHIQEKGIAVCKAGKTLLKVYGECNVGDLLQVSDQEGCAEKADTTIAVGALVGRSRVKKTTIGVELIEVDL